MAAGLVAALVAVAGLVIARTPQPFTFFGWIMAVAIVLAAAEPFTSDARLAAKVATAAINVVIGLAISTLVTGSARRSIVLRHYC